jgi:uncharacterized protein (TIGR00290 family)
MSHGVPAVVVAAQAEAAGVGLRQPKVTWDTYESVFREALRELRSEGVEGVVFGALGFRDHREWAEQMCASVRLVPLLPLGGCDSEGILEEFLGLGFRAVVVNVRADVLGPEWVGREVDRTFLDHLRKHEIEPCGENGEYHTLVVEGPIFGRTLNLAETEVVPRGDRFFLDINGFRLQGREGNECAAC